MAMAAADHVAGAACAEPPSTAGGPETALTTNRRAKAFDLFNLHDRDGRYHNLRDAIAVLNREGLRQAAPHCHVDLEFASIIRVDGAKRHVDPLARKPGPRPHLHLVANGNLQREARRDQRGEDAQLQRLTVAAQIGINIEAGTVRCAAPWQHGRIRQPLDSQAWKGSHGRSVRASLQGNNRPDEPTGVDALPRVTETARVTDHTDDPSPRDRIEVQGLGFGPGGAQCVRLNGVEQPNAIVIDDLHSVLRVRIGDRMYTEAEVDIIIVPAKPDPSG